MSKKEKNQRIFTDEDLEIIEKGATFVGFKRDTIGFTRTKIEGEEHVVDKDTDLLLYKRVRKYDKKAIIEKSKEDTEISSPYLRLPLKFFKKALVEAFAKYEKVELVHKKESKTLKITQKKGKNSPYFVARYTPRDVSRLFLTFDTNVQNLDKSRFTDRHEHQPLAGVESLSGLGASNFDTIDTKGGRLVEEGDASSMFDGFSSLSSLRSDEELLSIGFDCEWKSLSPTRRFLSYQFSVIKDDVLYEYVVLTLENHSLDLDYMLQKIFSDLGYVAELSSDCRQFLACTGYWDDGITPRYEVFKNQDELVAAVGSIVPLIPIYDKDGNPKGYQHYDEGKSIGQLHAESNALYQHLQRMGRESAIEYLTSEIKSGKSVEDILSGALLNKNLKYKRIEDSESEFGYSYTFAHDLASVESFISDLLADVSIKERDRRYLFNAFAKSKAGLKERDWIWARPHYVFENRINVQFITHFGRVDISCLDDFVRKYFRYCMEVQGGIVSTNSKNYYCQDLSYDTINSHKQRFYGYSLLFRDTMAQAPAGQKSLDNLGGILGIKKVSLSEFSSIESYYKEYMDEFLLIKPDRFFEYSSRDSTITLMYSSELYGVNRRIPLTMTSAFAKVMKDLTRDFLEDSTVGLGLNFKAESSDDESKILTSYDFLFRGLKTVEVGKNVNQRTGKVSPIKELKPYNKDVKDVLDISAHSYHGGFNACFRPGYYDLDTFDYDIQNAYPTAMCLVPDIDWEFVIDERLTNRVLNGERSLNKYWGKGEDRDPAKPVFAWCSFEFPADCKFPCIPINVEGRLIYPLKHEGVVAVSGPELYRALQLGARIVCTDLIILNTHEAPKTFGGRGSLAYYVKGLVSDRSKAQTDVRFGKDSLLDQVLKTAVNSGYGKIAQSVSSSKTWNSYKREMEELGGSAVTCPVRASLITALVRAMLNAYITSCEENGYHVYSVTTDGFITQAPSEFMATDEAYGWKALFEKSRAYLTKTEDGEVDLSIWAIKHAQSSLLNLTTRGNVGVKPYLTPINGKLYPGVLAKNSTRSEYEKESVEDRDWYIRSSLARTGGVEYEDDFVLTPFKDLSLGKIYSHQSKPRSVKMDFDTKRKIVRELEVVQVEYCGNTYEVVNHDTEPFTDVGEALRYYRVKKDTLCLRTNYEFNKFFTKVDNPNLTVQVGKDEEAFLWNVFRSIVTYHLLGVKTARSDSSEAEHLEIKGLAELDLYWEFLIGGKMSRKDKVAYIQMINPSTKVFKETDYKNCGRKDRINQVLPVDTCLPVLDEINSLFKSRYAEDVYYLSNLAKKIKGIA